jgi:hypothetical protein
MADDMIGAPRHEQTDTRWSDTRAELAKAMCKAQAALAPVLKDKTNPAFRSKYADLGAVLEAILPAFNANGLSLIQAPSNDGTLVGVTTFVMHESGEWFETTLRMRPVKPDPQGVGSAITYARRYAALAVAGAAPEDDDGNAASAAAPKQKALPRGEVGPLDSKGMSNRDIKEIHEKLARGIRACSSLDELRAWSKAWTEEIDKLPEDIADDLRGIYGRHRDKLKAVEA